MSIKQIRNVLNKWGVLGKEPALNYIDEYIECDPTDVEYCCALDTFSRPYISEDNSLFKAEYYESDEYVKGILSYEDEYFETLLKLWEYEGCNMTKTKAASIASTLHGSRNGLTLMVVVGGSGAGPDDKRLKKFMDKLSEYTKRVEMLTTFRSHHYGNYPLYMYAIRPGNPRKKTAKKEG